jgi:hypothetical protein
MPKEVNFRFNCDILSLDLMLETINHFLEYQNLPFSRGKK